MWHYLAEMDHVLSCRRDPTRERRVTGGAERILPFKRGSGTYRYYGKQHHQ